MKQENVPLYKVLNEKRTQGTIFAESDILRVMYGDDKRTFAACYSPFGKESIYNADYSALAVNHLATLAEILEEEVAYKEKLPFATEREIQFLIKAKEALKAIS